MENGKYEALTFTQHHTEEEQNLVSPPSNRDKAEEGEPEQGGQEEEDEEGGEQTEDNEEIMTDPQNLLLGVLEEQDDVEDERMSEMQILEVPKVEGNVPLQDNIVSISWPSSANEVTHFSQSLFTCHIVT